jgi:hypothetical protein
VQAAAAVVDDELVVVGSQAVLAHVEAPPDEMIRSSEVDPYPRSRPDRAIEIDRNLGTARASTPPVGTTRMGSGRKTVAAPAGWEGRPVRFEAPPNPSALPDLTLAKLAAGRPHDLEFVEAAIRAELVEVDDLRRGVELMPPRNQEDACTRLEGLAARISRGG